MGLVSLLLIAVAGLSWAADSATAVRILAAVVLVVAVFVALVAWGLRQSARLDRFRAAEAELDAVLVSTAASAGLGGCGCGHEHDPSELHITDAECAGTTAASPECPHTCESCVLSALRS